MNGSLQNLSSLTISFLELPPQQPVGKEYVRDFKNRVSTKAEESCSWKKKSIINILFPTPIGKKRQNYKYRSCICKRQEQPQLRKVGESNLTFPYQSHRINSIETHALKQDSSISLSKIPTYFKILVPNVFLFMNML